MGYYTIFDNSSLVLTYQTLTECELIIYKKKDIEYSLSLFPENFSFQYTIMRTIAKHGYYKSLLQYRDKKINWLLYLKCLSKSLISQWKTASQYYLNPLVRRSLKTTVLCRKPSSILNLKN